MEEEGVNSAEYWNTIWSEEDNLDFTRKYEQLYAIVNDLVPAGSNVLDIGSGVGVLAELLSENNTVTCSDHSDFAIKRCEEKGFDTIKLDIQTDLLPPKYHKYFDTIVCTEVIEHIEDWTNLKKMIKYGLKPGGKLIITCPNNCMGPNEEPEHVRLVTPDDLQELFEKFKNVQIGTFAHYLIGAGH